MSEKISEQQQQQADGVPQSSSSSSSSSEVKARKPPAFLRSLMESTQAKKTVSTNGAEDDEDCSLCDNVRAWGRKNARASSSTTTSAAVSTGASTADTASTTTASSQPLDALNVDAGYDYDANKWPRVCPPDSFELGRATWTFLHTMASHYPKVADDAKQTSMRRFLRSFSELYPCAPCAEHLRAEMVRNQPRIGGRAELGTWLCEVHNEVNERLGKATFDCSKIEERWRTGPSDGSCN